MKYFFDTEFIEDGKTIDLISIGIVAEDGREYYAINSECDFSKASDWVKENVLVHLPPKHCHLPEDSTHWKNQWKTRQQIRDEVAAFCGCIKFLKIKQERHPLLGFFGVFKPILSARFSVAKTRQLPEFWACYADYDWVVFCQLFGTMMDLPEGFPMYCRDLKQEADRLGIDAIPVPTKNLHNALDDARWNKKAYEFLQDSMR